MVILPFLFALLSGETTIRLRVNTQVGIAPLELAMLVNASKIAPGYEDLTLAIVDMPPGGEEGTVVYLGSQSLPPFRAIVVQVSPRPAVAYMQRVFTLAKGHYLVLACLTGRDVDDICTDLRVEAQ
jgi:hypothetical protein